MKELLILVYIAVFFFINFMQIKNISSVNKDILFDYLTTNILVIGLIIFKFRYHLVGIYLFDIFILIFINYIYIKDIKNNNLKKLLSLFLILNLLFFISGTIRYIFI